MKSGHDDQGRPPINLPVVIDGHTVVMELDTGAGKFTLKMETFKTASLHPIDVVLHTYTGEFISVAGKAFVEVTYENQLQKLGVLVVNTNGPNILGRDWLLSLKINWKRLFTIHALYTNTPSERLTSLINEFQDVFQEGLGKMIGVSAKIVVQETCKPKYFKARPVPHALRDGIEKELEKGID